MSERLVEALLAAVAVLVVVGERRDGTVVFGQAGRAGHEVGDAFERVGQIDGQCLDCVDREVERARDQVDRAFTKRLAEGEAVRLGCLADGGEVAASRLVGGRVVEDRGACALHAGDLAAGLDGVDDELLVGLATGGVVVCRGHARGVVGRIKRAVLLALLGVGGERLLVVGAEAVRLDVRRELFDVVGSKGLCDGLWVRV